MRSNVMKGLMIALLVAVSACTKVPPGYAGIVVNNYGSQRGVQDFPIKTGRVWYNMLSEDVYQFPTFQQNIVWSKAATEGNPTDESITVNSVEGATLNFDVQASITFLQDSVPHIFVKFRKGEDDILQVYTRSIVRDAFSIQASKMKATDIFGSQKAVFQDSALAEARRKLSADGISLSTLALIGKIRVDNTVENSINAVLTASQKAIEAQNKIVQATAEAAQMVASAKGDSASAVIRAEGQAHANSLLQISLTANVLQGKAIEKWDGRLPQVTSGATPFINITKP